LQEREELAEDQRPREVDENLEELDAVRTRKRPPVQGQEREPEGRLGRGGRTEFLRPSCIEGRLHGLGQVLLAVSREVLEL